MRCIMGVWRSKPNIYTKVNFIEIPEGSYRVEIYKVRVERFRDNKHCFEITFKVSGYHGKLWYYLWANPEFGESSTRRFISFFESFDIKGDEQKDYKSWVGKVGAVNVVHEFGPTDRLKKGQYEIVVHRCLNQFEQTRLPAWQDDYYEPHSEQIHELLEK